MGRPPSNGVPSFRFTASEVAEMESVLRKHQNQMPASEILTDLAEKFSSSSERLENSKQRKKKNDKSGNVVVQMKQVWNWFQNRRFAIRAKGIKIPGAVHRETIPKQGDSTAVTNIPQAPSPTVVLPPTGQTVLVKSEPEKPLMEFEARSANDGAWYDVAEFLSLRSSETGEMEVQARFSGFGEEEVEWLNVRKHVRQRSLPCESTECFIVLPGDLILCFQEGKEQALYFDAHVLNAQRRNHDVRGCRCRFLVRYDHNHTEEIVPLRKICRRPETDYRLQEGIAGNIIPLNTEAPPAEAMRYSSVRRAEQTSGAPRCNNYSVASMDTQVTARVESITVRTEGNMEISIVASPPFNNKTAEESVDVEATAQFPKLSDIVQTSKVDPMIVDDSVSNATAPSVTNGVLGNAVLPEESVSNATAAAVTNCVPANAVHPREPVSKATAATVISGVLANAVPPKEPVSCATSAAVTNGVLANEVQHEEPVSNATASALTDRIPVNAEVQPEEHVSNATASAVTDGVLANAVQPEEPDSNATASAIIDSVLADAVQPNEPVSNATASAVTSCVLANAVHPEEPPVLNETAAAVTNGVLANAVLLDESVSNSTVLANAHEEPVSNATAAAITNGVLANAVLPAAAMSSSIANDLSCDAPANVMDLSVSVTAAGSSDDVPTDAMDVTVAVTAARSDDVPTDAMDVTDTVTAAESSDDVPTDAMDVTVAVTAAGSDDVPTDAMDVIDAVTAAESSDDVPTDAMDVTNAVTAAGSDDVPTDVVDVTDAVTAGSDDVPTERNIYL